MKPEYEPPKISPEALEMFGQIEFLDSSALSIQTLVDNGEEVPYILTTDYKIAISDTRTHNMLRRMLGHKRPEDRKEFEYGEGRITPSSKFITLFIYSNWSSQITKADEVKMRNIIVEKFKKVLNLPEYQ